VAVVGGHAALNLFIYTLPRALLGGAFLFFTNSLYAGFGRSKEFYHGPCGKYGFWARNSGLLSVIARGINAAVWDKGFRPARQKVCESVLIRLKRRSVGPVKVPAGDKDFGPFPDTAISQTPALKAAA
jgi:hypothetical protein